MLSLFIIIYLVGCGKKDYSSAINFPKAPPKENLYDVSKINDEKLWTTNNAHDPSIFKDKGWYYTFSTDAKVGGVPTPGVQIRKSRDLIKWEWVGYAFQNGIPKDAEKWTEATNLWAPDITKIGDIYYLYYCASTFGTNQSFIGLATSKNVEGPYIDKGCVIKTQSGDENNAIDPNISYDTDGKPWMAYGSFFGGIHVVKLNGTSGELLNRGDQGTLIAKRNESVAGSVEAPYIIYNPELKKYYLFVSYNSLSSDYNVRVGRSDKIDGPYVDYNGLEMSDTTSLPMDVGNKILGGYKFGNSAGWIAPGHNSVLKDDENYFIVHHARGEEDTNWPYLQVRKMLWSQDGWPLVSPERYDGEKEQKISKKVVVGQWENLVLDKNFNEQIQSASIKLLSNGKIEGGNSKDYWKFSDDNTLVLYFYQQENSPKGDYLIYKTKIIPSWDWENSKATLVYTGINQNGVSIWGKKIN